MRKDSKSILFSIIKYVLVFTVTIVIACAASIRMLDVSGIQDTALLYGDLADRISSLEHNKELSNRITKIEQDINSITLASNTDTGTQSAKSPLFGKKIVYDGDSIAEGRSNNGGGYAALIAERTGSICVNFAEGGARLCSNEDLHSVVDNLGNLPADGDLYCFEGGINDFWNNTPIGTCDPDDYTGALDTSTICGAMETIFRYCIENFQGKPVCFVIVHKVQRTATDSNHNGDTFADYRAAMISVCQKYSIPYYDAFNESGLNGWNELQSTLFLNANSAGTGDGCHPNEEGYRRYYVPQLLDLFEKMIPVD